MHIHTHCHNNEVKPAQLKIFLTKMVLQLGINVFTNHRIHASAGAASMLTYLRIVAITSVLITCGNPHAQMFAGPEHFKASFQHLMLKRAITCVQATYSCQTLFCGLCMQMRLHKQKT